MLWTAQADPAVLLLTKPPDWLAGTPPSLDLTDGRDSPEGHYARYARDTADIPLLFLPGTAPDARLAALVPIDGDSLDRIEALARFCRTWLGRPAQDRRLTPFQRRRIPLELRAADAHAEGASYRDIAEAIHGAARVAREDDWRSSALRTEAIDLVKGGKALIADGYRKLLRHRRRS